MRSLDLALLLAVLLAAAAALSALLRRRALDGPAPALGTDDPYLLAQAADGPARAVQAAVVHLRALGLVRAGDEAQAWVPTADDARARALLAGHGGLAAGAEVLPLAVLAALREDPFVPAVLDRPAVEETLRAQRAAATAGGVLLTTAARRRLRRASWPLWAAAAAGVLMTLGDWKWVAGVPANWPLVVTAGVGVALLTAFVDDDVRVTRRARERLRTLTRRFEADEVHPDPLLSVADQSVTAAAALALLGGAGFERWAEGLFLQPELGRLATSPAYGAVFS